MMREEWDDVHIVAPSVPIHPSPQGVDHSLDEWWDPTLESFLSWYLNARRFDALLVNYLYLSKALTLRPPSCLGILDTHDRFAGRRNMLSSIGIPPEFFHTTEDEERAGIQRADIVVAIKEQEQKYFESLSGNNVVTVPFAEPTRLLPSLAPDAAGYLRIGLLGARNNLNFYNMRRFLDLAVNKVRGHMAPIKFVLAGTMCRDFAQLSVDNGIVELMGPVDDIADFYNAVDVVAVPMEVSSGQKIKIGEALAFGVPLISHAHAFEGYVSSHNLQTCRSFEQMVEACVELSFDRDRLRGLASACHRSAVAQITAAERALDVVIGKVEKNYSREVICVDAERVATDSFLSGHLLSLAHLISTFSKVVFLFDGDLGPAHSSFLTESRAFAQCFATGQINDFAHAEGVGQLSGLNQLLLEHSATRVWLYDPVETNELVRKEIPVGTVRHLSNIAWTGVPATGLVGSLGLDFVIGKATGNPERPDFHIVESFPSQGMDNEKSEAFVRQAFASGPPSAWIVTSRQNKALAQTFAYMLNQERCFERVLLIGGGVTEDQPQSNGSRVLRFSGRKHDKEIFRSRPELVIDLVSRSDPSYLYVAMFEGTDIALWRPALLTETRKQSDGTNSGCPLATLVGAFLDVTRSRGQSPTKGLVTSSLDLSFLYNRLVHTYSGFV